MESVETLSAVSSRKVRKAHTPTAISQNIVCPTLQLMSSSDFIQHLLTRLQSKMVSVVETQPTPRGFELLGGEALKSSLGSNGHEEGGFDGSMREREDRSASFGGGAAGDEIEGKR